jgi:glutathione S-transferase
MHSGFTALRATCSMSCGIRVKLHAQPPELLQDLTRLVELWHDGLKRFGGPFLAGPRFTAVDAFFCPVAFRVQTYGLDLGSEAMGYVKRLLALPSMRKWYEAGLAEPYRDAPHDEEIAAAGTIQQDLRRETVAG